VYEERAVGASGKKAGPGRAQQTLKLSAAPPAVRTLMVVGVLNAAQLLLLVMLFRESLLALQVV
jgi:hypothetical protein